MDTYRILGLGLCLVIISTVIHFFKKPLEKGKVKTISGIIEIMMSIPGYCLLTVSSLKMIIHGNKIEIVLGYIILSYPISFIITLILSLFYIKEITKREKEDNEDEDWIVIQFRITIF